MVSASVVGNCGVAIGTVVGTWGANAPPGKTVGAAGVSQYGLVVGAGGNILSFAGRDSGFVKSEGNNEVFASLEAGS